MKNNIPIPSGHNVYWEKWVDAYADDPEMITPKDNEEGQFNENEMFLDEEEQLMREFQSLNNIKTIFTPFGIMPLTEHSLVSNHFKLWVGHSNFKLTNKFYNIIGNVNGVESLDILTPYRFRMSIGKLFRDRDVMSEVKKAMLLVVGDIRFEP